MQIYTIIPQIFFNAGFSNWDTISFYILHALVVFTITSLFYICICICSIVNMAAPECYVSRKGRTIETQPKEAHTISG